MPLDASSVRPSATATTLHRSEPRTGATRPPAVVGRTERRIGAWVHSAYYPNTGKVRWARMLDEKRLRPDLRGVGSPSEAEFAIVHHELHMAEVDYNIWMAMGTDVPDYVLTHDGVPIISVYRRRK